MPGAFAEPEQIIRAPADATVALDNGGEGTLVAAGTELAVGYDLSQVFVTARVEETAVGTVRIGQPVEIVVDAYPGATLHGWVGEISGGSAALLSGAPAGDATGSTEKLTQFVPVKIVITDRAGRTLIPGTNVTVKIHRA